MNIDEDTSAWLGCPTPLEMYKHHCALLEDELNQTQVMLHKARRNIAGLVQLSDDLSTRKASAEDALNKARSEVARLNRENSEMDRKINGLLTVAEQRDYLTRENQRLLKELKDEKKTSLVVADAKLGNAINKLPGLSVSVVSDSNTLDLCKIMLAKL